MNKINNVLHQVLAIAGYVVMVCWLHTLTGELMLSLIGAGIIAVFVIMYEFIKCLDEEEETT